MNEAIPGYGGKGPTIFKITFIECAIALILYIFRAASASRTPRGNPIFNFYGLRWDFVLVTIATILACTAQALLTVSVLHGTGNHQSILSINDLVTANLWSWMAQIVAIMGATTGRLAVILFLLYVQSQVHRRLVWVLYIVGAATTTINMIEIGLILRQCQPVQALWHIRLHGDCSFIPITTKVGYLQGGIGALADFVLALYPAFVIGRLQQMRWAVKGGLMIVMAGGLVAGSAAIAKTIAIGTITKTEDISYATWSLIAWVWTEMWLIIIFGSIPPLWQLIKRFTSFAKDSLTTPMRKNTKALPASTGPKFMNKDMNPNRFADPNAENMYHVQLRSLAGKRSGTNHSEGTGTESKENFPPFQQQEIPKDQIVVTHEVDVRFERRGGFIGPRNDIGTFLDV